MNEKKTMIERINERFGIYSEEEMKEKIREEKEGVERLRKIMEERASYIRPFIYKLQIFTENDLYQYIIKDKDKPDWVKFKSVKNVIHRLYLNSILGFHVIPQEEPRPNTFIYYIPEISEEKKWDYISCIEEKNKLKTDCHEILFKKWNK